ncbi:sulfatase-like hydrolase/transferase [Halovenus amylolytica]|uniref:sulfatase-like hydrolase/transferase n=1 Tax=Halovenus amylolytica TaxID=2500550 RepID=UPI003D6A6B49
MSENIVLVTLDSLRADHCGPDSAGRDRAPTLRRIAEEGVEYEYAVAPGPRTPSSMPAIFTGEHLAPVCTEPGDFWERRRSVIRKHMQRHETLPEQLQDRGYHTIGVTVNPWTQDTAFDRGFDEFIEINGETLEEYGPPTFRAADFLLKNTALGERLSWFNKREWFIRWTDFYETISDRIAGAPEPYFLWVFLLDTHQPYIVSERDREESSAAGMYYASFRELANNGDIPDWVDSRLRRAYNDSVRSVDRFLTKLLDDTAADEPVTIVHSDHGEAFGEHGTYGHKQQLYQENVRVPLVVHNVPTADTLSEPLPLKRLPELVEAVTTPATFDPTAFTTDAVVCGTDDGSTDAVTTCNWKLIRTESGDELYNLGRDPEERRNVLSQKGPQRARLEQILRPHRSHRAEQIRISEAVSTEGKQL